MHAKNEHCLPSSADMIITFLPSSLLGSAFTFSHLIRVRKLAGCVIYPWRLFVSSTRARKPLGSSID